MRNRGRRDKKRSKLESKVFRVPPGILRRDEDNREYIPFCDYRWHRGILKKEYDCIARGCKHFRKLYTDVR